MELKEARKIAKLSNRKIIVKTVNCDGDFRRFYTITPWFKKLFMCDHSYQEYRNSLSVNELRLYEAEFLTAKNGKILMC